MTKNREKEREWKNRQSEWNGKKAREKGGEAIFIERGKREIINK